MLTDDRGVEVIAVTATRAMHSADRRTEMKEAEAEAEGEAGVVAGTKV
jgi:hypothetical protein